MRIDSHQHFWRYDRQAFDWIPPVSALASDHLPAHLKPVLKQAGIDGCIAVQARQIDAETLWLTALAKENPWILGVVGWIDLRLQDIEQRLEMWAGLTSIVGYRHIVQGEPADDFLLGDAFVRGVRAVLARGLSYDILVFPRQAVHVPRFADLVDADPARRGRLILDHGAKPDIAGGGWRPWADAVAEIARTPGLYCKLSGLVTEADHTRWSVDDISRYLDHLFECFGPERLLFGSDWPVCKLAADYGRVHALIADFVTSSCPDHEVAIFGGNAARAYPLAAASPVSTA